MRFLCLHGAGTSSQVFETQIATIRYEMDRHHTFDFVEGTMPVPIAAEMKAYYPPTDTYYQYYDQFSATSMSAALSQLGTFLASEGPFDGVIGFSQGASLAATFLIDHALSQTHSSTTSPPFKCAIFFSGGKPLDPLTLSKCCALEFLDPTKTGPLIKLPTAHVWGRNDTLWPGASETLCGLCEEDMRAVFVHDEGHDVPGARAKEAVQGAIRVIRRTVDRALGMQ